MGPDIVGWMIIGGVATTLLLLSLRETWLRRSGR